MKDKLVAFCAVLSLAFSLVCSALGWLHVIGLTLIVITASTMVVTVRLSKLDDMEGGHKRQALIQLLYRVCIAVLLAAILGMVLPSPPLPPSI